MFRQEERRRKQAGRYTTDMRTRPQQTTEESHQGQLPRGCDDPGQGQDHELRVGSDQMAGRTEKREGDVAAMACLHASK
ncbi:hypothetical protein THAOC_35591 [Thalassiosira oceanica]|uniref:Uncharacterized protein n=1 Tax=Thalassiosira oceanica TaxID=159749 RepID=K0RA03_THAOC|nr:hypothetical protein THAOC_35591 [Thalassiosira oceanica]|eukprot:EJK45776.1 hypothetical protein THAOC_35591 [Thalassiosira oceanica]